jgi:hypothetical protein
VLTLQFRKKPRLTLNFRFTRGLTLRVQQHFPFFRKQPQPLALANVNNVQRVSHAPFLAFLKNHATSILGTLIFCPDENPAHVGEDACFQFRGRIKNEKESPHL